MEKGSLGSKYFDRTNPMDKHMEVMMSLRDFTAAPAAPQMFGNAGREHMEKYGASRAAREGTWLAQGPHIELLGARSCRASACVRACVGWR
jgi:hypothetical protein